MPPKVIGPYRVLETLGSGGVGTVYRALDRRSNDVCALKLLNASPALDARAARRLAREFETLVDLSHRCSTRASSRATRTWPWS
jgi:serine/threonine protein kinase